MFKCQLCHTDSDLHEEEAEVITKVRNRSYSVWVNEKTGKRAQTLSGKAKDMRGWVWREVSTGTEIVEKLKAHAHCKAKFEAERAGRAMGVRKE